MKLLTYTTLEPQYSNYEIKGDIALYSLQARLPPKNSIMIKEEAMFVIQNEISPGVWPKASQQEILPAGTYSIKQVETFIKTYLIGFTLSISNKNLVQFKVPKTGHFTASDNIIKALGFQPLASHQVWQHGTYTATKPIGDYKRIQLICDNIKDDTRFIDGKQSKCLYSEIHTENIINYTPQYHIWHRVVHPTRHLEFRLVDENNVDIPFADIQINMLSI